MQINQISNPRSFSFSCAPSSEVGAIQCGLKLSHANQHIVVGVIVDRQHSGTREPDPVRQGEPNKKLTRRERNLKSIQLHLSIQQSRYHGHLNHRSAAHTECCSKPVYQWRRNAPHAVHCSPTGCWSAGRWSGMTAPPASPSDWRLAIRTEHHGNKKNKQQHNN